MIFCSTKNKNCYNKDGSLFTGLPDCACLNSQVGFTLNKKIIKKYITNKFTFKA